MIKTISKTYLVDTNNCDYLIFENIGAKNLKINLHNDGRYNFSPATSFLKGYEGTWDISDDDELSNFVFHCNNGKQEVNRTLFIDFEYKNKDYRLCFY